MTGTELSVVGWFATSIIRNIIDTARSVLGSNYALQSETEHNLTKLESSLPLTRATIEEASKSPLKNRGLIEWLDNLRSKAHKVKDVLDDLEAKRFRESLNGKNKVTKLIYSARKYFNTLFLSDKELRAFKSAVDEFCTFSERVGDFINLLREHKINANAEHTNTNIREYIDPNAMIFGRDIEIFYILDIILNELISFSVGNSDERELRGNTSEAGRDDNNQDISKMKSSVGEQPLAIGRYGQGSSSDQNFVCIKNWKLPVLPICGLGGVGKTTIAKFIYKNEVVTDVFDIRVWFTVSESFDVKRIMVEIILSIQEGSHVDHMMNLDRIANVLINTIKGKKFFLVIDDVHDGIEPVLRNNLFPILGNGAPGSFVLVTTHNERVAKTIGNIKTMDNNPMIITLGALESEWFDILFKYYAFGDLFHFDPEIGKSWISSSNNAAGAQFINLRENELIDLESIAKKIAKKLHGLPLAGRVIGKLLYAKIEKKHWEDVLRSDWWDHPSISREIRSSLSIAYGDLDHVPGLKQCFEFCSIFPKHYVFDRNTLVQMWMANDFIEPNKEESRKLDLREIRLEDVGRKRFDELVERSLFLTTVSDDKYVMHELIQEFIVVSSEEFYFANSLNNHLPSSALHLGINCDGSNKERISSDSINANLRTLILFGNWNNYSGKSIGNIFAKSNGLRLLDLSYDGSEIIAPTVSVIEGSLHWTICLKSHLRFVDLSFAGIKFIPGNFSELFHLQVLDMRGCDLIRLPRNMNKFINLRHLYASAETVSKISGIGKLTKLQELKEFRVEENKGHRISELSDMNEISGHLLLTNLQNVTSKEEAAKCQLDKKTYLKSLELTFVHYNYQLTTRQSRQELEVLEALNPTPTVEILRITGGRGDSLPGWMRSTQSEFSNLKCIKVSDFSLTTLPAFGELASLEVLSLKSLPKLEMIGDEFYGRSDVIFPSLKELEFYYMYGWRTWSDAPAETKSFPLLQTITLKYCKELMEMPTNILTSSVVELKLSGCRKINNMETILQHMPYLTQLSIIDCYNDLSICCTALRFLEVLCLEHVKHLCFVGGLKSLVNLRKLDIQGFYEILELFEEAEENDGTCQENPFLTSLNLDYLSRRNHSCSGILPLAGRLKYLRSLLIRDSPVTEYTEEEGSWFTQLTSLETLEFSGCTELRGLPSTLPSLTKLKKLTIVDCPKISSLPEIGLPPYLTELHITGCSEELVSQCQPEPDEGDEWCKISHIPHVLIKRC